SHFPQKLRTIQSTMCLSFSTNLLFSKKKTERYPPHDSVLHCCSIPEFAQRLPAAPEIAFRSLHKPLNKNRQIIHYHSVVTFFCIRIYNRNARLKDRLTQPKL